MIFFFTDPLTKNWFLAGKPYQIASILIVYLIFATRLGPWYMRNKRPYDLRTVIKYYNLFQIAASLYLFYQVCIISRFIISNFYLRVCLHVFPFISSGHRKYLKCVLLSSINRKNIVNDKRLKLNSPMIMIITYHCQ